MEMRIEDANLVDNTTKEDTTTTTAKIASSLEPTLTMPGDESCGFIWIPLAMLLGVLLLSAVVYLLARNRRRLAHIYCKRKQAPSFSFNEDSDDSAMEQGDLDDPTECLLKGKLQIDNHYGNYQPTQVTQSAATSQSRIYA